jgi:hypothetical protein
MKAGGDARNRQMEVILQYIASADRENMDRMIEAVIQKCDEMEPDWENILLAFPWKDREKREENLQNIGKFLRNGGFPG